MLRSTAAGLVTATVRPVTLAALTCLLVAAQTTGLPAASAAPATGTAVAARAAAVPQPGTGSSLHAVTCTSASNCWAVGDYTGTTTDQSEAVHWNGSAWTLVPTPDPAASSQGHNDLYGISCVSRGNCWAVGEYGTGIRQHRTLAVHWDGSAWSQVSVPNPGGAPGAWALTAVSCTAASNCWAVGHHIRHDGNDLNLALHWNGSQWSWGPTPEPDLARHGVRHLNGVSCTGQASCWAVGFSAIRPASISVTEALHWDGTRWSRAATPDLGGDNGVTCTSAASCWAVSSVATHWNGARWSSVHIPHSDSKLNELTAVSCARATDCWAAGILDSSGAAGSAQLTDALRWNGTKWARVATPNPGGTAEGGDNGALNELDGIACGSADSCWAVGHYWDNAAQADRSIALHWTGTSWSTG